MSVCQCAWKTSKSYIALRGTKGALGRVSALSYLLNGRILIGAIFDDDDEIAFIILENIDVL